MKRDELQIGDLPTSGQRNARALFTWGDFVEINPELIIKYQSGSADRSKIGPVASPESVPQASDSTGDSLEFIKANIKRLLDVDWGRVETTQLEALAEALDDFLWDIQFASTPDHVLQKMQDQVDAAIKAGTVREMFNANGNFIEP